VTCDFKRWRLTRRLALGSTVALVFSTQFSAAELAQDENESAGTNHTVIIQDLLFLPNSLKVEIGDTITWINNDFIPHTATANDKSWDSKNLAKGESFSLVVDEHTSLEYFCVYHPNMTAKIELSSS